MTDNYNFAFRGRNDAKVIPSIVTGAKAKKASLHLLEEKTDDELPQAS